MAKTKTKTMLCWRPTLFESYSYNPGQTVDIPLDQDDPDGFIRTAVLSPDGEEIPRGPFYRCTQDDVIRNGVLFSKKWIWPWPNQPAPEGVFEEVSDV